ncbi:MAG: LuxR C-terminal-related transcriptional regulator [Solirubrobacterales bacterium]
MSEERRCLVVDGHPLVRLGVRRLLDERFEVEEAVDGGDALEILRAYGEFDVAIIDLARSVGDAPVSGTDAIRALRKASPGLGIVAHGPRAERQAATDAIKAGATAYVAKSSPASELTRAVDAAADSETFVDPAANDKGRAVLTRRQRQILQMIADGHSTIQVARRLGLASETVRTHTKAALARLSARDRAHAVAIGLRQSLID